MFNISTENILKKCTDISYRNGIRYYRENRIKSVQFYQEKHLFEAVVAGTRNYNVRAHFDPEGEMHTASCSCTAYDEYWGYCKHIVALLLFIRDKDESGHFRDLRARKAARHMFALFQNKPSQVKTPVNLEVTYVFSQHGHGQETHSSLCLRMGIGKLYIVRNIQKLFQCIEKNEILEFGKNFTFDPVIHTFKEEDQPILQLLREMYETEKLLEDFTFGYSKSSLFKDKQAFLTESSVKRILAMFSGKALRAEINNKIFENLSIVDQDFPVQFRLVKEEADLILQADFPDALMPLTRDGEYYFGGDRIYRVSKQMQESFKPFYLAMTGQKVQKIRFTQQDRERFVSEILPYAEKAGQLEVDEDVQSIIEKVDLQVEIFLDRSEDFITADVKFIYGDRAINPFARIEKQEQPMERILVRDMEKEGIVLDILAESDSKVRNNRLYLHDDDNIYGFVFHVIPKLQEYAAVFYSESFKNMTIRDSYRFSGKIRLNAETDLLEFSFDLEGIERAELWQVFRSLREKKKYYKLKNGGFLNLESNEIQKLSDFLDYLAMDKESLQKEIIQIPKYRALYLDQRIREAEFQSLERGHYFKEFVQNIKEPADMEFNPPAALAGTLRGYQKFGFKWLKTLVSYGMGGILADDMGLGKTLQVITLILSDREEKGCKPSLVVVPTSLVYNWQAEVEKFAPQLKVAVVSGAKQFRQEQMQSLMEVDVVITSYPLIRRDIEEYLGFGFRYCIIDEAQHIKNPGSLNARTVKQIKAERKFALTGTPVENSLTELWSIFDFVLPGYLFSHARFVQRFESPIVKEADKNALQELGRHIQPFILRRLKNDVLKELPEKIEHKMVNELTEEQKKIYAAYLQQAKNEIDEEIKEHGYDRSHIKILAALTRLRQICCHPSLFLEEYEGESGKMQLLQEIIQDSLESGHRILLFSQFTGMLQLIKGWLMKVEIPYLYLDGSTPSEERGKLVKSFNGGEGSIFLISLKAGGTGLNLTGADTVIHYDPWWNPAVEEQATDRAYRIGQIKSVHVMKLITKGTIEEKIFDLQEKKRRLIDAVIHPGENLMSKMSEQEVRALFE